MDADARPPRDPYRRIAPWYDPLLEPLNRALRRLAMRLLRPEPGLRALDLCCGTGSQVALLLEAGCEAFGVDRSPSMLAEAGRKLGARSDRLVRGDARALPFPDASFDLVVACLCLHELPADVRQAALDESLRVLRPGARLLLVDHHPGPLAGAKGWGFKSLLLLIERLAGRDHYAAYRDFLRAGGLPALVAERGLTVTATRILTGGNLAVVIARTAA